MEAQDYKKLVEALRCCIPNPPETCKGCAYDARGECNVPKMMVDAADAISELQDTVQAQDKALKECASQLAKMGPKRGEWKRDEKRWGENSIRCSLCGAVIEDEEWGWRNWNYCYHCGAKMEVQDGQETT